MGIDDKGVFSVRIYCCVFLKYVLYICLFKRWCKKLFIIIIWKSVVIMFFVKIILVMEFVIFVRCLMMWLCSNWSCWWSCIIMLFLLFCVLGINVFLCVLIMLNGCLLCLKYFLLLK